MVFWIIAGAVALISTALIVLALLRRQDVGEHPAAYDLRVYRDQLKEVDRDLARGVIEAQDAERVRTEVSRRILAADAQLQAQGDTDGGRGPAAIVLAVVIAGILLGGSGFAYFTLGTPGLEDQPLKLRFEQAQYRMDTRMSQAEAEAEIPASPNLNQPDPAVIALIERLREAMKQNPDDLQGQELLSQNEASLGNFSEAAQAQAQIIRLKGDDVTAAEYAIHANLLISAVDGYISPEAEASIRRGLELDPHHSLSLYYLGLMNLQNDRPDAAFPIWDRLLRQSTPDAPWVPVLRANLMDLAWFAGAKHYQLPPQAGDPHASVDMNDGLSGPDADDIEAASELSAEDRSAMIRGMVEQLSDRLATEGGTPQEWGRLIGAYGMLGEAERAFAIWEEAQQVFATEPGAVDIIREGARQAGLVD